MRPKLLFADDRGTIYDHPFLEMAGASGTRPVRPAAKDLVRLPAMSRLYFHPGCPPYGYDPRRRRFVLVREAKVGRRTVRCHAVSAFIQQGWVRLLLPAMDYGGKKEMLPMWAYSTVGFHDEGYYAPAFEIDDNFRWHPDNFDDRALNLTARVQRRLKEFPGNRLVEHLRRCAVHYHCFAAKNFFHLRWEAPIPTSPACNSGCLGCISQQPDGACVAPQERIAFVPEQAEIVEPMVRHLNEAPDPIVSFGQGCEGEPIMQWERISQSIAAMRSRTAAGTINLNTNGSVPRFVDAICASGLDSIRVSLSSARPEMYARYYRPRGYGFEDVLESIRTARRRGVFTMLNYLIFPGLTDQPSEYEALRRLVGELQPDLIHMKNLNIDPDFYWTAMAPPDEPGMGLGLFKERLAAEFPGLQFGYYNKTRNAF
jgi:wyosine [tRNA(Phe)-imidazoG37] synthetase (radical SAM superfamily)